MTPIFSAEIYVCYKRSNITINMALKVLSLVCFARTHPNLSTRLKWECISISRYLLICRHFEVKTCNRWWGPNSTSSTSSLWL